MLQVVFASRPLNYSVPAMLNILLKARQYNTLHDLTGALIYRDDLFLQLLEGTSHTVRTVIKRIMADPRHTDIAVLYERSIPSRTFSRWNMYENTLDDPRWGRLAVREGEHLTLPQNEVLAFFTRMSDKPLKAV